MSTHAHAHVYVCRGTEVDQHWIPRAEARTLLPFVIFQGEPRLLVAQQAVPLEDVDLRVTRTRDRYGARWRRWW